MGILWPKVPIINHIVRCSGDQGPQVNKDPLLRDHFSNEAKITPPFGKVIFLASQM